MSRGPKKKVPHVSFLDDDADDARDHGERSPASHEDGLVGTGTTHGASPDVRGEEPYGELAPSSETEGGDD